MRVCLCLTSAIARIWLISYHMAVLFGAGHVAHMNNILVGKYERKKSLERSSGRCEENIKMNRKKITLGVYWIHPPHWNGGEPLSTRQVVSWLGDQLTASQENLCSVVTVRNVASLPMSYAIEQNREHSLLVVVRTSPVDSSRLPMTATTDIYRK